MERRRADTLGAPDRKRSRLALSDGEPSSSSSSSSSSRAGSSFTTPIDLTSSPPSPPRQPLRPRAPPRPPSQSQWSPNDGTDYMEYVRPRWQPDDEVDECPICEVPFSFWYRKHHCRKCGRVVCASCSPHRITIPRQYIVRPPAVHRPSLSATFVPIRVADGGGDRDGDGDWDGHTAAGAGVGGGEGEAVSPAAINPALGGGEEVRLCNPCVPDPNPEPPRVFVQPNPPRHRSYHSMSVPRQRSSYGVGVGVGIPAGESSSRPGRRTVGSNDYPCFGGLGNLFGVSGSYQERPSRFGSLPSSSQQRLPSIRDSSRPPRPRRQISERDICPICNSQFPPLSEGSEEAREAHIRDCIENHGPRARSSSLAASGSANGTGTGTGRTGPGPIIQPQLPVRMVAFTATEKDCLGHDAEAQECTICMEEYEVGQPLVRLECLCKFHKRCIVEWFERKKECPVHKS
ncbi:hypothetical protein SI65_06125 [Aspergillus cristatus]|uniref:FYVE-type domain-containing protein n=1 Tax=Aspergillus cristatus TaxID=573508 RepID=A0A1E3BBE3_ASPCR|nr:hypothetical protein SI65_06125 [Aspergillus cristatus]